MNSSNQISIFHLRHDSDLFEVSLNGYVLRRITCYVGGQHRQDMQFDDLPVKVQEKVLDRIAEVLKESDDND